MNLNRVISLLLLGYLSINTAQAASQDHDTAHTESHNGDKQREAHEDEHEGEHQDEHADEHADEHGDEANHTEELSTEISAAMAQQVGIKTLKVARQSLHQTIPVYGNLSTSPEQLSHVRARYSGLIQAVEFTIGDQVNKGDLLAKVESNESLKTYNILAPITGTIIQRHANTGEITQDQVLFSIANFDTLWAEFRVFPSQQALVSQGQSVFIEQDGPASSSPTITSTIQHVIPALNKPYQLARVTFDNRTQGLMPGLMVEGKIVIGEFKVDQAVEKQAIQAMGKESGVFVKNGDQYVFTPLELGRSDERFREVLSGLSAKQEYVSVNSYLIKADIEKSAAEHAH